jgi:hypothetical protein
MKSHLYPVTPSPNCSLNWYTTPTEGTANSTNPTIDYNSWTHILLCKSDNDHHRMRGTSEIIITITPIPLVRNITITMWHRSDFRRKNFFNLTVDNDVISTNYTNETFTYYRSLNGANEALEPDLILNKLAFENTATSMEVWTRVVNNTTGCHSVAKITLQVPVPILTQTIKL